MRERLTTSLHMKGVLQMACHGDSSERMGHGVPNLKEINKSLVIRYLVQIGWWKEQGMSAFILLTSCYYIYAHAVVFSTSVYSKCTSLHVPIFYEFEKMGSPLQICVHFGIVTLNTFFQVK